MITGGDWRVFGRRAKRNVGEQWRAVDDHIEVGRARRCIDHPHCRIRLSRLVLGGETCSRRGHPRDESKRENGYRDDPAPLGGSQPVRDKHA
jgi:hypothetical protein